MKPIYKLINVPKKELESIRLDNNTNIKIEEIKQRPEKLTIGNPSINTLEVNKLRYYPKLRNYYSRPSPGMLLYEETPLFSSSMSYNGKCIYEWNIDGLTEYQIITVLHNMLMYATICRTSNNTDQQICEFSL